MESRSRRYARVLPHLSPCTPLIANASRLLSALSQLRKRRDKRAVEEAAAEEAAKAKGESIAPTGTTQQGVL